MGSIGTCCCPPGPCDDCEGSPSETYKMTLTIGGMHPHSITKRFARPGVGSVCPMIWTAAYSIGIGGSPVAGDVITLAPFVNVTVTAGMISGGTIPDEIAAALNNDPALNIYGPESWIVSGGAVEGWSALPGLSVTNQPGSTLTVTVTALSPTPPDLHQSQTVAIWLVGTPAFLPSDFVIHCTYGPVTVSLAGVVTLNDFAEAIRSALAAAAATVEEAEVTYARSGSVVTATAAPGVPFYMGFVSTNFPPNGQITVGGVAVRISRAVGDVRSLKIPGDMTLASACCATRQIVCCGTDTQFWSSPVFASRTFRGESHIDYDDRVLQWCNPPAPDLPFQAKNGRYWKLDHISDNYLSYGCRRRINSVVLQICPIDSYGEELWQILCTVSYNTVLSIYWSNREDVFEDAYDIFCNTKTCIGYYRLSAVGCVEDFIFENNGCGTGSYLTTPVTSVPYATETSRLPSGVPVNGCPPQVTVYTHSETRQIFVPRTCDLSTLVFPKTQATPCPSPNSGGSPCVGWQFPGFSLPYSMAVTGGDASSFTVHEPLAYDDWSIDLVDL
jgi:hypothetical protein